ncbi:hypothetical protein BATDEDRAFT_91271 [Batrachochytrium dendrobatidis JAM81]|uniref:Histone-lysine N-methyltransferase, H3 lysine-79 specific n=1 Tax=Batrachochytrium dendrobatidis (strain JAM81 / FGSC 10211) TaxID=684364 RepID=F4P9R9_BATDJ|nr:histone methyltransferase DOT1 [Batrachochytrium dendrobatidis JAM81]EGF77828.1 hypothetical protein BATDEDRAFT_91271 [Batrachochytrium dendrobatidis JAM81]|eukprot:XP_006681488.1 hypothetical protein BATDEDRAFT_91271 [Batrachochytrium dendrobatidis JAM81]
MNTLHPAPTQRFVYLSINAHSIAFPNYPITCDGNIQSLTVVNLITLLTVLSDIDDMIHSQNSKHSSSLPLSVTTQHTNLSNTIIQQPPLPTSTHSISSGSNLKDQNPSNSNLDGLESKLHHSDHTKTLQSTVTASTNKRDSVSARKVSVLLPTLSKPHSGKPTKQFVSKESSLTKIQKHSPKESTTKSIPTLDSSIEIKQSRTIRDSALQKDPYSNEKSQKRLAESESGSMCVDVRKKKKHKGRKDRRDLSKDALLPAIESIHLVNQNLKRFSCFGDEAGAALEKMKTITLEYPGDGAHEVYGLAVPSRSTQNEHNPIQDIYSTTQMIAQYCISQEHKSLFGDSKSGIIRHIIKACHRRDPNALESAIADYNRVMIRLKDKGVFEQDEIRGPPASCELTTHILEQAYGFSNNVYGEIKHSFVRDIIKHADIQPHHTFLDMGSGIGNVILQVAAECLCECYGIEIMETPSELARKQKQEFLSRMRYYAKPCGRIVVKQGNFLDDAEIHEVISRADVIFVNNYAFDAELNLGIIAKFLDLKESAKVVSLRSFVPVDRRPSLRRSNAIESIFTVKEYHFAKDSVSWMVEGGSYYVHTVDRSQLADFE